MDGAVIVPAACMQIAPIVKIDVYGTWTYVVLPVTCSGRCWCRVVAYVDVDG